MSVAAMMPAQVMQVVAAVAITIPAGQVGLLVGLTEQPRTVHALVGVGEHTQFLAHIGTMRRVGEQIIVWIQEALLHAPLTLCDELGAILCRFIPAL